MADQIKPGVKVSWTHVSQGRRTMSMRLREGTVESVTGEVAVVKLKSGRRADVAIARLRLQGQKSAISEFVEVVREAVK